MKVNNCEQTSPEWWDLKVGKISGTRFGQVISNRKNKLVYELMNEKLDGFIQVDEFVNEEMQYGIDNEDVALKLYSEQEGIEVKKCGAILSDYFAGHMSSPDGYNDDDPKHVIVQEVKCTMNGTKHLERIYEGIDSNYLAQCINYFACSNDVQEVHFISYCGYREERPIHVIKLTRDTLVPFNRKMVKVQAVVDHGLEKMESIINEVEKKLNQYNF